MPGESTFWYSPFKVRQSYLSAFSIVAQMPLPRSGKVMAARGIVALHIQVWSPGLEPSAVVLGMIQAQLSPLVLSDLDRLQPDLPLLLLYADPWAWMHAAEPAEPAGGAVALLGALSPLLAAGQCCRLVNSSCLSLPALVAWCVDPASPLPPESIPRFPEPEAFEALLATQWLQAHPEQLQAYQALESHPLAAVLDQRSPDLNCLVRYRQAATLEALLQVRQDRSALEVDVRELVVQLASLQNQQLEALGLRDQLGHLQARLLEADALQARCSNLQLGFLSQQNDLEYLARRMVLLEQLVGASSDASLRLQTRLAQTLV